MDIGYLRGVITRTGMRPARMRTIPQHTYGGRNSQAHNMLLQDYIREGHGRKRILDIGIGASNFTPELRAVTTRELAQKFLPYPDVEIIGIDRDLGLLEVMLSNGSKDFQPRGLPPFVMPNLRYIEADAAQNLGVEPNSADTALCFNVFQHLSTGEIAGLTQQVFLALKIGGKFYFSRVPLEAFPASPSCLIKTENDTLTRWLEIIVPSIELNAYLSLARLF
ncbi:class I SAM-dependent methyltransferase [Candidatus Saganbacteria bacterium]|nr:class I SAM-dependent methyltransferase [Candidatus Saganbacteria bacterium]